MKTSWIVLFCLSLSCQSLWAAPLMFEPRMTLSGEYTSNLFLDKDEKETWIATVSPGATLSLDGRAAGFSLSYDPAYIAYSEFDQNNYWRHNSVFHAYANLSRTTVVEIDNNFLLTDDPISDRDSTIRRGRNTYVTDTASISMNHQFGASDTASLSYEYSELKNDDETIEDNKRHTPQVDLTYWFVPNSYGVEAQASYTHGDFDVSDTLDLYRGRLRLIKRFNRRIDCFVDYEHHLADYVGETEDYQVYEPSLGVTYRFDETSFITLAGGYYFQDREISDDESGITVDAIIEKGWETRRGGIWAHAGSGWEQSHFGAENLGFTLFYEAGLRAQYALSERLSANAYCRYRRSKYTDLEPDREDDLTRVGAGVAYQAAAWLLFELGYHFNMLESDMESEDYHEHRGLLSITLRPSQPMRLID